MSARLADVTRRIAGDGGKALVAYLTAGYPSESVFVDLAVEASRAGADVIEVGIPFSDPIADGPTIQASSEAALAAGMTVPRALALAARVAERVDTPLVAMSYLNPLLNMGLDNFVRSAARAGISGAILPDVPLEESTDIRRIVRAGGLDLIDLVAPTSSDDRVRRIAEVADGAGFLYLVSVTGVTGSAGAVAADIEPFVARVRGLAGLPLYVGFGVSTEAQARQIVQFADGVIVGSQLVRLAGQA
ncbi:MAG: tryptophan synthase subunit alpha, partial [Candidatus Latescibacterota bacterium]